MPIVQVKGITLFTQKELHIDPPKFDAILKHKSYNSLYVLIKYTRAYRNTNKSLMSKLDKINNKH